MQPLRNIIFI